MVNDIAMTVLPNAPIDTATGLPVPTIVVATDGGASLIKDDGSVVSLDLTTSSLTIDSISFSKDSAYIVVAFGGNTATPVYVYNIRNTWALSGGHNIAQVSHDGGRDSYILKVDGDSAILESMHDDFFATGTPSGLSKFNVINGTSQTPTGDNVFTFIASDYNTGWMVGDSKLATLSDTDVKNISSANLNPYTPATGNLGTMTLDPKKTYKITITGYGDIDGQWPGYGAAIGGVHVYTGSATSPGVIQANLNIQDGGTSGSPISTTVYVRNFSSWSFNTWSTGTVTVYSISECDYNRSVYNNPIEVFGTITKTPVMPGADLVSYGGFSRSNYLQQPYNSDLDFGTGDFSIMGWLQASIGNAGFRQTILDRGSASLDSLAITREYNGKFVCTAGGSVLYTTGTTYTNGNIHFALVRKTGTLSIYVNGVLDGTVASTANVTDTDAVMTIGVDRGLNASNWFVRDKLALLRVSATAPTAEQIAKVYNDEKHLFRENAKATLYGTSDAVTALAYDDDTELLHVGTSAGRSDFQGLRRINNTTRAIGTAISAVDGFIVEE
jgi:hypothetical protein